MSAISEFFRKAFVGFFAICFAACLVGTLGAIFDGKFFEVIKGGFLAFVFYKLFKWLKKPSEILSENGESDVSQAQSSVASLLHQGGDKLGRALDVMAEKAKIAAEEADRKKQQKAEIIAKINERNTLEKMIIVKVIGGHGIASRKDQDLLLWVSKDAFVLSDENSVFEIDIPFTSVRVCNISGPGKVTTNIGASGGGFGVEGALEGMAIATALNALTTHSSVKTIIHISTDNSEYWLRSKAEPEVLRMMFSRAFLEVSNNAKSKNQTSIAEEIEKLLKLKDQGILTEEEYTKAKSSILGGSGQSH